MCRVCCSADLLERFNAIPNQRGAPRPRTLTAARFVSNRRVPVSPQAMLVWLGLPKRGVRQQALPIGNRSGPDLPRAAGVKIGR